MDIKLTLTNSPKARPPQDKLGFGNYFTDHMFTLEYSPAEGWHNAEIKPYAPIPLDPSSMVLHYGQEIFEGLKAYKGDDGSVRLFRPTDNIRRFNTSNERLGVPVIDEKFFLDAMLELVRQDVSWVPSVPDSSLYIRPFLIATDPFLGVRASANYMFIIILSPVGAYYAGGMAPTKILVENEDVRAVRGGLGYAKTGANYAATIRAQERAKLKGYTQVMWLDAIERKYVEEIGTSNAFFVIGGKVITPPLNGSILPGITRDSCIKLLRHWNLTVEERHISIGEVIEAAKNGTLTESFASGTAAVISPIGEFCYGDEHVEIGENKVGAISQRLYDELTSLQWGRSPDPFGWTMKL